MNGSGATNNTNISVNIDGNGNASLNVTSDGAAQLGEAINLSVLGNTNKRTETWRTLKSIIMALGFDVGGSHLG